jgi:hypothetical protein
VSVFAECRTLGKTDFAECYCLPSARHSANLLFAECFFLPSVALGKNFIRRVPDEMLSAKIFALGKDSVSGSDHESIILITGCTCMHR